MTRDWFSPAMLPGTAYSAFNRLDAQGPGDAEIDRLYAIAPLQFRVAELELQKRGHGHFTFAQAQGRPRPDARLLCPGHR